MPDERKARRRGRPRRFDDRRLEVLRTAARTFSELGFRQATLEDIAVALGITRPALYHYARSKDTLLAECGKIARRQLSEAVDEALRQHNGAAQIVSFFRRYCEVISDDFGRCFVLTDLSEMDVVVRETMRDAQIELGHDVTRMVRLGVKDGTIRPCDAIEVSRTIFAGFNGIARRWTGHHEPPPAHIADIILDLFFNGLTPRETGAVAARKHNSGRTDGARRAPKATAR